MLAKKKCRQYDEKYLAYGFVESLYDQKQPMCLICQNTFSNEAMKLSRLIEHLKRKYSDKMNKPLLISRIYETNKKYTEYLLKLKEELSIRFSDLFEFEVQPWMMDPFGCDMETVSDNIQEELIELKCNDECKYKFERGGITELSLSKTAKQMYPNMWSEMAKILLCFPTSYLVECGFSAVNKIVIKERSRIDICMRGDIRLKLTNLTPNIKNLAATTRMTLNKQCK